MRDTLSKLQIYKISVLWRVWNQGWTMVGPGPHLCPRNFLLKFFLVLGLLTLSPIFKLVIRPNTVEMLSELNSLPLHHVSSFSFFLHFCSAGKPIDFAPKCQLLLSFFLNVLYFTFFFFFFFKWKKPMSLLSTTNSISS